MPLSSPGQQQEEPKVFIFSPLEYPERLIDFTLFPDSRKTSTNQHIFCTSAA